MSVYARNKIILSYLIYLISLICIVLAICIYFFTLNCISCLMRIIHCRFAICNLV